MSQVPISPETIRILVPLERYPEGDYPPFETETVWAHRVSGNQYRVDNIPFYAMNLSADDIVEVEPARTGGALAELKGVVKRGGHSTFRIIVHQDEITKQDALFNKLRDALKKLGCSCERANNVLWAIDSPPSVNPGAIRELLDIGDEANLWGYEIGYAAEEEWEERRVRMLEGNDTCDP
jgi:uncharacterized protein DUF4265